MKTARVTGIKFWVDKNNTQTIKIEAFGSKTNPNDRMWGQGTFCVCATSTDAAHLVKILNKLSEKEKNKLIQ